MVDDEVEIVERGMFGETSRIVELFIRKEYRMHPLIPIYLNINLHEIILT